MVVETRTAPTVIAISTAYRAVDKPLYIRQIVIHPSCKKATLNMKGELYIAPSDLASFYPLPNMRFDELHEICFPEEVTFDKPIELRLPAFEDQYRLKKLQIGAGVQIGKNTKISFRSDCIIGEGTKIGENCEIDIYNYDCKYIGKRVKIGDNCILKSVSIGDDTEIGPGAKMENVWGAQIGEKVKIGCNCEIYNGPNMLSASLMIGANVTIGDNVRINLFDSVNYIHIGEGARLENATDIRKNVEGATTLKTKDSPYAKSLHIKPKWPDPLANPFLSDELRKIAMTLDQIDVIKEASGSLGRCTEQAAKALSAEPALFLQSHLSPQHRNQVVRFVGQKDFVIVFNYYGQRNYFGDGEVDPLLLAEEYQLSASTVRRLLRYPSIISNIVDTTTAHRELEDIRFITQEFGVRPPQELFIILELLFAANQLPGNNLKFISLGSGIADDVKIASLFMPADGVEKSQVRHQVASEHLPQGSDIKLYNGDFFDFDISLYNIVYINVRFPIKNVGFLSYDPKDLICDPGFVKRLGDKLKQELRAGAVVIMAPVIIDDWIGRSFFNHSINRQIARELNPIALALPAELEGYDLFRRT